MRRARLLAAAVAVLPSALAAQGALGVQGFGYPTGQLGSAALALGGASAEVDPASALNPATLGNALRYTVYMQYEPEFRRTSIGSAVDESRTMRFPAFMLTGGFRRFTGGISATTFLDRTWRNVYSDSQVVGGEQVPSTLTASSAGAMTDARVAGAYWVNPRVQVGLGLHAIVGQNRIEFGRSFPENPGIGGVTQLSTISYSGRAVSLGVIAIPMDAVVVGASYRAGGQLEARQDGGALSMADVPDRMGLSVAYTGIPNTTIAARYERTAWSQMRDLGSAQMTAFDATDVGLGLEVVGPRIAGANTLARFGARARTLPFGAAGEQVRERGLSGGLALPLARGRAIIDLTAQRALRSAGDADERAWMISIGLGIRP